LDRAEEMLNKSLEIEEQLGRRKGMASAYGNLGVLYMTRGELDRAEEMLNKSLEIEEQLGRREGMASDYGNLGVIYILRGEPNRAEEMHKKALAIFEQLARFPQHAFRIRNRRGWAARKSSRAKPGFSPSACSGEHPLVRPVVFLG
jgi:tetratricopeptide (TPR) repeat protein